MAYDTYKINYNNQNMCVSYYTGCQLSDMKKFKSTVNKIPLKFLSLHCNIYLAFICNKILFCEKHHINKNISSVSLFAQLAVASVPQIFDGLSQKGFTAARIHKNHFTFTSKTYV